MDNDITTPSAAAAAGRSVRLGLRLAELTRTAAFRLALAFGAAFALSTLPLFLFIYWQTALAETARIDRFLMQEADLAAQDRSDELQLLVTHRLTHGLHRLAFAALFDREKHLLSGNFDRYPAGLPDDGKAYGVTLFYSSPQGESSASVRAVAKRFPDGKLLVLARDVTELAELRATVLQGLEWGVAPGLVLAIVTGTFLSLRAMRRIRIMHESIERIMAGHLNERLPTRGTGDELDQLAISVNRMLAEISRLIDEVKGVGENIAHDLRTPLSRVRARLERSRDTAENHTALQAAIDRAIIGLDQALAIITALLRISEIESGRRRSAFAPVRLASVVGEIAELYGPIAEEKNLDFEVVSSEVAPVLGDHDLLIEAVANLVGNAIKFSPGGGMIQLGVEASPNGPVLWVRDTGPGIAPAEREAVLKRFHRSDRSRHIEGSGLGLSLVAAIIKLHGFSLQILDAEPGCLVKIFCFPATEQAAAFSSSGREASRILKETL